MFSKSFSLFLLSYLYILYCSQIHTSKSLSLTIYNDNFGVVKDVRFIQIDSGTSSIYFTDVAKTIQTETVSFTPLNKTVKLSILQQNYEDNLANKYGILQKYIGKIITIYVKFGKISKSVKGILLAYQPAFIIKTENNVNIYDTVQGIQLKQLPQGFLTHPTLIWKCKSQKAFNTEFEVSYRATGFSWKSDYIVTLNNDWNSINLAGWVTIDNRSGKKYSQAKLKLIAGDVNIARNSEIQLGNLTMPIILEDRVQSAPAFKEKTFGDYHMYTLSRLVDINQSSSKQIQFIQKAQSITINKYYVISINTGGFGRQNINSVSTIQFLNSKINKLGIPLPKGTLRVFQKDDTDDSLQFIGQDSINHTPVDQKVKINTGNAFDIVTKLISVNRKSLSNGYDANMRLQINNHSQKLAKIKIEINNVYGDNLKLQQTRVGNKLIVKQNVNKFVLIMEVDKNKKESIEWNQTYRF